MWQSLKRFVDSPWFDSTSSKTPSQWYQSGQLNHCHQTLFHVEDLTCWPALFEIGRDHLAWSRHHFLTYCIKCKPSQINVSYVIPLIIPGPHHDDKAHTLDVWVKNKTKKTQTNLSSDTLLKFVWVDSDVTFESWVQLRQ